MENIFKQQPKYMNDIRSSIPTMANVFRTLKEKCGVDADGSRAAPLPRGGRPRSPLQHLVDGLTEAEIKDVILYLADIAHSLHSFVDCFDAAAGPMFEEDFHLELPAFYEAVIPALKDAHLKRRWEDTELRDFLREKLTRAHLLLPTVFRQLCQAYCVKPILEMAAKEKMEPAKIASLMEFYVQVGRLAATKCLCGS